MHFIKTSLTLTFAMSISGIVSAADIYVSKSGNINNTGTIDSPFSTITKASQVAKGGDTVHVLPGTYNETVKTAKSGSSAARIRFVSDQKWGAKIIGSGTEAMWNNTASYVDISGFDISGPGRLGILNQGSYVVMSGNHIHDIKVSGGCTGAGGAGIVNANYSGSDGDIIGNLVHDIGVPGKCLGVQGIYSSNLRGKILNNIVYRASAFGIHLWHAANNVTIANNTIFNNGSSTMGGGLVFGTGDAPGGIVLDNSKIINNIVFNNPLASISTYCYSGENCIGANNIVANNLVYGNGKGITLKRGTATGTISADPQFINYQVSTSGDFHLKSTSPAINKGLTSGAPINDFDGAIRGGAPDIGAFESKGVTAPIAGFSVSNVNFENVVVGERSPVKTIKVTNSGGESLILSNFKTSGDFVVASTSTCSLGKSYVAGATCNLDVSFLPTVLGTRTGSLVVESNSYPSVATIALSGTGVQVTKPVVSVSTSSVNFGDVLLGSASSIKVVTITNSGTAPLIFPSAFVIAGDFVSGGTGTCKVNVAYAPNTSCTASLVFKPSAVGTRIGSLSITSNASTTVQKVSLTGNGTSSSKPIAVASVSSLSFGSIKIGTKSEAKIVTIKNAGNAPLIFGQGFTFTGKFSFGGKGTCLVNVAYAPGATCTASVMFAPTTVGSQTGTLNVLSNAAAVSVNLSGTGVL
jgi:parallel beta-helix repeat protein